MIYSCTSFVILSVQKKRKIKLFFKYLKHKKRKKLKIGKRFKFLTSTYVIAYPQSVLVLQESVIKDYVIYKI